MTKTKHIDPEQEGSDLLPVVPSNAYFIGSPFEVGDTCEKSRDAGELAAITAEYLKKKSNKKRKRK
jgi:hypothetical protein